MNDKLSIRLNYFKVAVSTHLISDPLPPRVQKNKL